ncbi:helix-turn-helix transcriptional regulator [Mycobacteroides abscessus]|uniref:helix-turn-helix transcriptional regulator n=1 Tax=Mycobacteroides abscessus TaxID=36809 RepID=UPI0009269E5C|nr:hypothetical protein [Mycobacteroides abscessus]MDM2691801.1 hypothetical protein [Mycobacteroides abscessus]MDM2697646.1 hypothetical protein [Mycobacteroides abscessus]MDM2701226.1 hypothetical protein [Mycobacteroides abscessus]MDO3266521.1 hypothetical protein [Mycobacteroides abscessus subsp. abscessus]SHP47197.1 Uncharacterised protein [Mycobacteroides abscessus subsp. abscessus]
MGTITAAPPALRPSAAAPYLGLTEASLTMHRQRGTGPRYVKRGRLIWYPVAALDAWMAGD